MGYFSKDNIKQIFIKIFIIDWTLNTHELWRFACSKDLFKVYIRFNNTLHKLFNQERLLFFVKKGWKEWIKNYLKKRTTLKNQSQIIWVHPFKWCIFQRLMRTLKSSSIMLLKFSIPIPRQLQLTRIHCSWITSQIINCWYSKILFLWLLPWLLLVCVLKFQIFITSLFFNLTLISKILSWTWYIFLIL